MSWTVTVSEWAEPGDGEGVSRVWFASEGIARGVGDTLQALLGPPDAEGLSSAAAATVVLLPESQ